MADNDFMQKRRDQFKLDHDLAGCDPHVLMTPGGSHVEIRAQLVDHSGPQPQRTGRFVHLSVSTADAMRLLALLKDVQKQRALPDFDQPTEMILTPPAKDRN